MTKLFFGMLVSILCFSCGEMNTSNVSVKKEYITWDSLIEVGNLEEIIDSSSASS